MDEYGQIRPGNPDYRHDVIDHRSRLDEGTPIIVNLTARMTQQRLMIVPATTPLGPPAMGLGPGDVHDYWIVGRFEHGMYVFRKGRGMSAPGYVASKLGIEMADAEIVAAFLDDLSDPDRAIVA